MLCSESMSAKKKFSVFLRSFGIFFHYINIKMRKVSNNTSKINLIISRICNNSSMNLTQSIFQESLKTNEKTKGN